MASFGPLYLYLFCLIFSCTLISHGNRKSTVPVPARESFTNENGTTNTEEKGISYPRALMQVSGNTLDKQPSTDRLPGFRSDIIYWTLFACGTKAVCINRSAEPILYCQGCFCDSICRLYDDCCPDMYTQDELYQKSQNPPLTILKNLVCMHKYLKTKYGRPNPEELESFYFVDKCPESYQNDETKTMCESNTDAFPSNPHVPVYSVETKLNYRNRFCAICHGDTDSTLDWKIAISCDEYVDVGQMRSQEDILQFAIAKPFCDIQLVKPAGSQVRNCSSIIDVNNVIDHCSGNTTWGNAVKESCSAFTNIVNVSEPGPVGYYKNIFCAFQCGLTIEMLQNMNHYKHPDGWKCINDECSSSLPTQSFSMLFNFNPVQSVFDKFGEHSGCDDDEIYDTHQMLCREIFCSKGRLINNHSCVPVTKSTRGVGYILKYTLKPGHTPHRYQERLVDLWNAFSSDFFSRYTYSIGRISTYFENYTMNVFSKQQGQYIDVYLLQIEISLVLADSLSVVEIERKLLTLMTQPWSFGGEIWTPIVGIDVDVDAMNTQPFNNIRKNAIGSVLPQVYQRQSGAYIEINLLTQCAQVKLIETEYTLDPTTGNLNLVLTGEKLNRSQYILDNTSVLICAEHITKHDQIITNDDNLERIFTLCSFIVSLVCLALTLVTYMTVRVRYTVPGKNIIALVCSLFVAQVVFLVAGSIDGGVWACRVLGLAIHYFWLKVFCWKNVLAYHMYLVFTQPLKCRYKSRLFLKYCIYAFLAPIGLIVAYTTAHLIMSDAGSIGYGGAQCFLSRPIDVGLAFALPIGLILIANGYFFARTILVIQKMSEMEKHSSKSRVRQTKNYIKMSFPLGLSWVIGFVANIVQMPFMWYIFILVNGSLGAAIFIIEVCNSHMISRIKQKFKNETRSATKMTDSALFRSGASLRCQDVGRNPSLEGK